MNYGAEIWGGKVWTELDKLHLAARKYILGVSHSTPTDGIYAELGRQSLHISRKITIAKYYKRLSELPEDRSAKKAFGQLNLDDNNNHYNWVSVANSIRDEFSLDLTESEEKLKNKIKSAYSKTLIQNLANCVN